MKRGTIQRKDLAQLLDYEGYFLEREDPTIRVMLVGNRVPKNLQYAMDHHGFEYCEIPETLWVSKLPEVEKTVPADSVVKVQSQSKPVTSLPVASVHESPSPLILVVPAKRALGHIANMRAEVQKARAQKATQG